METALVHLDRATDAENLEARRARINLGLGNTRLGLLGYAHASVRSAFEQAEKHAEAAGDVRARVRALSGQGTVTLSDGNLRSALAIAERQLEASAETEIAQYTFLRAGHVNLMLGNLRQAISYLDRAATIAPEPGIPMMIDALAEQESWRGLALVQLGAIDAARTATDAALARAADTNLAWGSGTTIYIALEAALLERDYDRAARFAEDLLANSARYELETHVPIANFCRHLVRGLRTPRVADLDAARAHYAKHEALRERWHRVVQLSHLAELELRCQKPDEAALTLDKAFEHAEWGGEGRQLPELWRLRGEIALQRGTSKDAADCFRRAIDTALSKESLLFALRSAIALARLSKERDKLRAIRNRFGESTPCADLVEADKLLK